MSATNKGSKMAREKIAKGTHSLQNGKTDTSSTGVKHQPTAEQLRIAQITSDRADMEPEVAKKVKQVCELTGRTQDEALAILHDCDYDANLAVESLLENQGDQMVNDWQEISKKKKAPVSGKGTQSSGGDSAGDLVSDRNDTLIETERIQERSAYDGAPRGRRERGGPPRFNRGRGSSSANGDKGGSVSRERPAFDQGGGRGGRRRGGFSASGGVGRGGGASGRGFSGGRNNFDTGSPHIDTWSNDKTPNGTGEPANTNAEADWGTEDWTADEWSGSLEESRVFTASASGAGHVTTAFGGADSTSSAAATSSSFFDRSSMSTQVFEGSSVSSSALRAPGGGTSAANVDVGQSHIGETSVFRSSTLQSSVIGQEALVSGNYDLNLLLQQSKLSDQYNIQSQQAKLSEPFGQEQSAAYLSRYTQEATEVIKNAVGIGGSGVSSRSAVGMEPIGHASQNCVAAPVAKQPPQQQQRPRLPPPSKIPSSAVEMPASMNNAHLDVQFGNWDIPSVSSSAAEAASLSFGMPQGSGPTLHSGAGYDMSVSRSSNSLTESSKSSLLTLEDLGLGAASKQPVQSAPPAGVYQGSANKDFVNAKMVQNQQANSVGYQSSQSQERKASPYAPSQSLSATNQSGSHTSISSQMPFSQGSSSYPAGVETSAISSMYKSTATSASPTQQHVANQYGSSTSFSGYPSNASDSSSASGLAAAVAAAQQQYSYTGTAAPGFGPQPVIAPGSGGGYGQGSASYAASSGGLHNSANKAYNNVSLSMTDKQPATSTTYSSGNLSSQAYDAANSYQFGSGQMQSSNVSGYPLSGSSQYQTSGQLSYQGVPYNQSSLAPGYESTSGVTGYGTTAHSYQSNMYQNRDNSSSAGNYQPVPESTAAGAGYQRSVNGINQSGSSGVIQQQATASAASQSASMSAPASVKLVDSINKLSVKDGQNVASSVTGPNQYDTATSNLSTAPNNAVSTSLLSSASASTASSRGVSTTASATTKSTAPSTSKALVNMPVGGPAVMNNYMIAQPPGFQLAAFGYPTAQQPLQYSYEDLQLLQSSQRFQVPYYDMPPFQPATTMTGRETSAAHNAQSYAAGSADTTKLAPIDPMSPVAVQPTQTPAQQATVPGSAAVAVQQQQQQSYLNPAAMHPAAAAGYGYYYPGAAGIMSVGSYYTPMIQMGGLAVPLATNPATATTQYQKAPNAAMYGSHAGYNVGAQGQDFSKSFGATQSGNKQGPAVAPGTAAATSGDVLTGGSAFSKNHVQTYDKTGFHSGTPPPPFNMAGAQPGAALSGGYGAQYLPTMIPHQSHSTQILHHPMSQDASISGRGASVAQNQTQQPKSANMNKTAGYSATYWGTN